MGIRTIYKMEDTHLSKSVNVLCMGFLLMSLLMGCAEAKIGYFWHISDLHLDTIYSTRGDVVRSCWRIERQSGSSGRTPGRFGDYLCDSPWSLLESATRAMKTKQGDNVEFVLWTGDGLSHSAHRLSETEKMEILRNITDLLGRTFSSQFVFPVLGHEDGSNTNFRRFGELCKHWLPSEALYTFEKGGYYTIEQTKSHLRIIALNTNLMRHDPKYSQSHLAAVRQRQPTNMDSTEYKNLFYHHGGVHQHHYHGDLPNSYGYNNGHHHGTGGINAEHVSALSGFENEETQKQWDWLEDVLAKSKSNTKTVYIVGHIPPGSDERHVGTQQNGHTTFTERNNLRYLKLVRKYSSIIQGQFFGHLHSDSFRIIYDDKGKPVSWIMISPSVTPRKMSVGSNNPAMRLYKFDTVTGQVLDYTQYYLDLSMANREVEANWISEYNLTHYYGLNDISAISLHNFVDRFTGTDPSWFAKYYRANTVRYETTPCEGICMLNHYCAITRVDYTEFRQCLEKEQNALGSHSAPQIPSSPLLIFMLSFILTLNISKQLLPTQLRQFIKTIDAIFKSIGIRKLFHNWTKVKINSAFRKTANTLALFKTIWINKFGIDDISKPPPSSSFHEIFFKYFINIINFCQIYLSWMQFYMNSFSNIKCDYSEDFIIFLIIICRQNQIQILVNLVSNGIQRILINVYYNYCTAFNVAHYSKMAIVKIRQVLLE